MWVYNLLDIAATMTEAMIFYVMTLCFCREFRFPKWISRMLPLVVHFLATIFLTYLTDLGANKIYVLMVLMVGLCLICYRVSLHYALIVVGGNLAVYGPIVRIADSGHRQPHF